MFKAIVFILGIVWASLLLVAWGGSTESHSAAGSAPLEHSAR